MASKKKKVVAFRKPFNINIGLVIFVVIFVYLVVEIVLSINKITPSVYCVEHSYIDNNFYVTGIAIRDEMLVNATDSGYISYYIRDGERVGKNATVYTVDETGTIYDYLAENASDSLKLSAEDYELVKNRIAMFRSSYSEDTYYNTYNFKYDLQSLVLEINNDLLIEQATSSDLSMAGTFKTVASEESGIVTYYQDGYENASVDNIRKEMFDAAKYDKVSLKTGDIINAGSPVYKLICSDNWNVVAPVSDEQADMLRDGEVVTVKLGSLNYEVDCNYTLIEQSDGKYINIIINKLMVNFADDRFIDVCIMVDSPKGLKIPNSAIVSANAYKVPLEYMTVGSNSKAAIYLNKRVLNESGELSIEQISPTIYYQDEEYCYIAANSVEASDVFVKENSEETISVGVLSSTSLNGVYSANKGTAAFKMIEVLNEKDDYCIVKEGMDYSISMYDYIILDGTEVTEGQIIY